MGFTSVITFAQKLIEPRVRPGDSVIDATVGGGNDTAFLAKRIGPKGVVFGFDVQSEALEKTRQKLSQFKLNDERVRLFLSDHARMQDHLPKEFHGEISAVMFNLGYLPDSDHQVITQTDSTITAIEAALNLLKHDGIITIIAYPGHPGGDTEAAHVREWASKLPESDFQVLCYEFINRQSKPPFLLAVLRK